jgi:hypothetical protein
MSSDVFSKWKKNDEFIMKISTYILILGVLSYYWRVSNPGIILKKLAYIIW